MRTQSPVTIANKMMARAHGFAWHPGAPLRPYRCIYDKRIEISYYIDARKSEATLEFIALDDLPLALGEVNAFCAAFGIPETARAECSDRKIKYRWTDYVQRSSVHVVRETTQ